MSIRRFDDLMAYLDGLTRATSADYNCPKEIFECIQAIREELGLAHGRTGEENPECSECSGLGFVSIGEGIRGVKKCVACGGLSGCKR